MGARKSRPSPPPRENKKKFFGYIYIYLGPFCYFFFTWVPFCYFFFIWGLFCYVFLIFGGLFTMWGSFCYFLLHGGSFLGFPTPLRKFLRAPMIARRVREHAPRKFFLCDRNLVSSGHILLRFCLKNDKNNDKL